MNASEIYKPEANPRIPRFTAGDTVRVNFRIREGERERIQAFQGVVIRLNHGKGPAANFTVRRISGGIGIERIFPMHSPLIESLEITRYGSVRRAKLYYLRGLQGRAARIKELNPRSAVVPPRPRLPLPNAGRPPPAPLPKLRPKPWRPPRLKPKPLPRTRSSRQRRGL